MIKTIKKSYSFQRLLPKNQQKLAKNIYHLVQDNYQVASNWTVAGFESDLQEESNKYYGVYYLEELVGFVAYQVVLDEATISNIVVEKEHQQKGLATSLWQKSQKDLEDKGIETVFLEVRESNLAARQFYQSTGFESYYRRKDYYHEPKEDAILYRYDI